MPKFSWNDMASAIPDEALSDDPQAAVTARAQTPVTQAVADTLQEDYANRLTYPQIVAAMKGDPEMRAKVAENSLGFAMGSLGAKSPLKIRGVSIKDMTLSKLELQALKAPPSSPIQKEIQAEIQLRRSQGEKSWRPEEKQPKGLDMSEAARMARAKKLGFDTEKTYYHGTTAGNFDEFLETNHPGIAAFVTEDSAFARKFAEDPYYNNRGVIPEGSEDPYVHALKIKAKKTFDPSNESHLKKLEKSLSTEFGPDYGVSQVNKIRSHVELEPKDTWQVLEDSDTLKAIKSAGFDSMHVTEEGAKNIALFQPNQLRRPSAAFDPKKAKSGNLSAAITAAALGAGAAASAGSEAQAAEPNDAIPMRGPDGKIRMIPASLKGEAIAAGGRVVR